MLKIPDVIEEKNKNVTFKTCTAAKDALLKTVNDQISTFSLMEADHKGGGWPLQEIKDEQNRNRSMMGEKR